MSDIRESNEVEAISADLEKDAAAYLEKQNQAGDEEFKKSTITIVLQLMPLDDHPQGRLGLLSIRNDDDAPLFGPPLRGEAVEGIIQFSALASLVQELKNVLPVRREERLAKISAAEKARQLQSDRQTTAKNTTTQAKKGKADQRSNQPSSDSAAKQVNSAAGPTGTSASATPSEVSIPRSVLVPSTATSVSELVPEPAEKDKDTPRQLTLF